MQTAAQALVDSSISKTVNCPEDIGFDAFADRLERCPDARSAILQVRLS